MLGKGNENSNYGLRLTMRITFRDGAKAFTGRPLRFCREIHDADGRCSGSHLVTRHSPTGDKGTRLLAQLEKFALEHCSDLLRTAGNTVK